MLYFLSYHSNLTGFCIVQCIHEHGSGKIPAQKMYNYRQSLVINCVEFFTHSCSTVTSVRCKAVPHFFSSHAVCNEVLHLHAQTVIHIWHMQCGQTSVFQLFFQNIRNMMKGHKFRQDAPTFFFSFGSIIIIYCSNVPPRTLTFDL